MKTIIRFESDYETNENGKVFMLEVQIAPIEPGKNIENQNYLKEKGFRFDSIDADSITATARGDYDVLFQTLEQLQNDGWQWE